MTTRERRTDQGAERARRLIREVGQDLRTERRRLGMSAATVATAVGVSSSLITRSERALVPGVSVDLLARMASVVGLDLSLKLFPGGTPLRDTAQLPLAAAFRSHLHPMLRWGAEVPFPIAGDRRAWDGMVSGAAWRYGVEFESAPNDGQAILRRVRIKERDGGVDGVLLVVPDSHRARDFVRTLVPLVGDTFPIASREALARLRRGEDPGGSSIVIVRHPSIRRASR